MKIELLVNGESYKVNIEPRRTLADALRIDCSLTGTHLGCEHGVCGSCTVLLEGEAVRSCLMFAVQCDGARIRTVEGLAGADGEPHPLQKTFANEHGLQCGFCTPGFLMLSAGALEQDPQLVNDPQRLRELLTSNLCRCTGYESIQRAVNRAAAGFRQNDCGAEEQ